MTSWWVRFTHQEGMAGALHGLRFKLMSLNEIEDSLPTREMEYVPRRGRPDVPDLRQLG